MEQVQINPRHQSLFVAELRFMHGDADQYTTKEIFLDSEEDVKLFDLDMRWLINQDKYYRRLGSYNCDNTYRKTIQSDSYTHWFYSTSRQDFEEEKLQYLHDGVNFPNTYEEYIERGWGENLWPKDRTNPAVAAALESYVIFWYDQDSRQFKITP